MHQVFWIHYQRPADWLKQHARELVQEAVSLLLEDAIQFGANLVDEVHVWIESLQQKTQMLSASSADAPELTHVH